MKSDSALIWLVMVAGFTLGVLLTGMGLLLLDQLGPSLLIVGLIFLAFGGGAFFSRHRG